MANNQLTAIAVMKVLFLVVIGIPLAGQLLPESLIWLTYPFPNFWAFEAISQVFMPHRLPVLMTNAIAFTTGLGLLGALFPTMRRKFKLK